MCVFLFFPLHKVASFCLCPPQILPSPPFLCHISWSEFSEGLTTCAFSISPLTCQRAQPGLCCPLPSAPLVGVVLTIFLLPNVGSLFWPHRPQLSAASTWWPFLLLETLAALGFLRVLFVRLSPEPSCPPPTSLLDPLLHRFLTVKVLRLTSWPSPFCHPLQRHPVSSLDFPSDGMMPPSHLHLGIFQASST